MRMFPGAGRSSGSGAYSILPSINPVSHVWQTPARHAHLTGIEQASANSRRLPYWELHGTVRPLRVKETLGPVPTAPDGGWGGNVWVLAIPGVMEGAAPNSSE